MNHPTSLSLSAVLLTGALGAQVVQLPDNHHLGESATQNQASGTASFWGGATTTGRRFQILYDASHFTGIGGVTAGITIQHVRFRGEDTEHNRGGQAFAGVTANLYKTTLSSAAALNAAFATNLAPAAPNTTTLLGTVVIPSLNVGASIGSAPNNDIIDLDFSAVNVGSYDPTGASGPAVNLLLDVLYVASTNATDPQGTTMVAIQDTTGAIGLVRGRAVFAAAATALTGTLSSPPPVMKVEFNGPGGFFPSFVPATTERYGAACGGAASSFYQLFPHDQYFDLKDPGQVDQLSGLKLVPDVYPNPNFYTVQGGAAPVDLVNGLLAVPTTQGDDDTMIHPLPGAAIFSYPGGATNTVRPSSNGYVIVDPNSTEGSAVPNNFLGDFSPTVAEFLGTPNTNLARFAPFWHDLSPNKNTTGPGSDPQSGLHIVDNVAGNEVLVTWYRVGRFNSVPQVFQESHTMQCSLNWATGIVEFRYGPMDEIWGDTFSGAVNGITGFSRGAIGGLPSVDPQSRDLSIERPFATNVEGASGAMGQTAVATPIAGGPVYMGRGFVGQTLRWNATNVPAGSLLGAQLLDLASSRPGLQIPGIIAPGCVLSLSTGALIWETFLLPPSSVTGTIPLTIPSGYQPGFQGAEVFAQFVVLDGLFGGGPLVTVASNAVRHVTGNN